IASIMNETLVKHSFQLDLVCFPVEPVCNPYDSFSIDVDYIAPKLWSEILDLSFPAMSEVA
ncbi:MAG: hypothetical protein LH679_19410, partial [Cyanobacteria bacterium CAN_BIN43]|nr:hypothetical protein [Cyanobacteria bacterium CAN_BIN43]